MGFLDFFAKKTSKSENERSYYPGGRTFGIKLLYDPDTDQLSYIGRYAIRGSFKGTDVVDIAVKEISNTHGVVLFHGRAEVLFTSDILPLSVCKAAQEWLIARGEGYASQSETSSALQTDSQASLQGQSDPFEELKKLKELADLGIITAEEYEIKRQQLLERI